MLTHKYSRLLKPVLAMRKGDKVEHDNYTCALFRATRARNKHPSMHLARAETQIIVCNLSPQPSEHAAILDFAKAYDSFDRHTVYAQDKSDLVKSFL